MSRVVIFDSGIGGLSVYQEIVKQCPSHDYIFVSDNQSFPYGTKSEDELIERVLNVTKVIEQQYNPDLFVVACNSASTIVLPYLRDEFAFPFVGVVPAIKPAAKASLSGVIGLLATPGTIERAYTNALIDDFASDCRVIKVGSADLVHIAEQKMKGDDVCLSVIEDELMPFFKHENLDVLVLACTHFPFLGDEIQSILHKRKRSITLMDSGKAVANRVVDLFSKGGVSTCIDESKGINVAAFTAPDDSMKLRNYLTAIGFHQNGIIRVKEHV